MRQPVGVVWNVDFNALERKEGPLYGSFNLTTLAAKGKPGGQGGHITVLDDYQVQLPSGAFLQAGDTLDPIDDADLLAAALLPESRIMFLRIKNSWGELRPDYPFARGMPGHHDLYMDYLDGPIAWCKEAEAKPNAVDEFDDDGPKLDCEPVAPLRTFWLPPGY